MDYRQIEALRERLRVVRYTTNADPVLLHHMLMTVVEVVDEILLELTFPEHEHPHEHS